MTSPWYISATFALFMGLSGSVRAEPKSPDLVAGLQQMSLRVKSQKNLKQIGVALHNYHDTYAGFPPAAICDKNGKPLLSWRVAILPFLEQAPLYRQFHLDEPWSGDHNKRLIAQMPKVYALPGDTAKHELSSTCYRALYSNDAVFDLKNATSMAKITDGLANTIMVVEAAEAVPWTKPDELKYDPKKLPKLGYHYGGRCNVLMASAEVHALRKNVPERTLHLMIQRSDDLPFEFPE